MGQDVALTTIQIGPLSIWVGASRGKYPDGNQLLVEGSDSVALFDTPLVSLELDRELARADLMILGHVHEDHMVGLARLDDRPVFVHESDLAAAQSWEGLAAHYGYTDAALDELHDKAIRQFRYTPRPDAQAYSDGHCWDLGRVRVRAIHMPGHTRGHCVLMIEPQGIAFIGDIDLSSFGPYYGDACSSLTDFRLTLERIAHLPASRWVTSHHKGVIDSREAFLAQLDAFAAQLTRREARILELLARGPATVSEIAREGVMYRPGSATEAWMVCAEERCVIEHLQELRSQGRVVTIDPDRFAQA
ncbi:MAG: hypothetical protein RL322_1753 [Pseudomonadota bacterium]|jgi:glyoxylase-like metal-dependent hydrolase (beta-lactamase superfamily II)